MSLFRFAGFLANIWLSADWTFIVLSGCTALILSFLVALLAARRIARLGRLNEALRREIAQRVAAEAQAKDLNRELNRKIADFETLLEVIPIGIAVAHDPECRNITINPALARMMGVPRTANISKSGPDAASMAYRIMADGAEVSPDELPMQVAAATGREVHAQENEIVRADGSSVHVLSFASPLFDEQARVRGVLNACVDITWQKDQERLHQDLERRLRCAERIRSLGTMAAGMAHDFNNLLTGVIGHASLALERVGDPESSARNLALALESAEQAAAIVGQVIAFTGHSPHHFQRTNLEDVMVGMKPEFDLLAGNTVDVRLWISEGTPAVMADRQEIGRAIRNVMRNAAEAIGATGGIITVEIGNCRVCGGEPAGADGASPSPGDYAQVRISDTGPGMCVEIAERCFDPFFSTKFLGRGLGLAEVLGIVRAHRGCIRLATSPETGTSLELLFPAAADVPAPITA